MHARRGWVVGLMLAVACGETSPSDAGPGADAANTVDGGAIDASPDAATRDAATSDAGPRDAGPPVDECAEETDDCADGAICVDDPVGYHCACAPPQVGDGVSCVDAPIRSGVAVGAVHTCVIEDGDVRCFGDDKYGQLGDEGPTAPAGLSVAVPLPADAVDLAVGDLASCAVLTDGTLWCWGRGLVTGVATSTLEVVPPTRVGDGTDWRQVVIDGPRYGCGLRGDAELWCWGTQIPAFGVDSIEAAPRRVDASIAWAQLIVGLCGVTPAGALECWEGDQTGGVVEAAPGIEVARAEGCVVTPAGALYCRDDPTGGDGEAIGEYVRVGARSDWVDVATVLVFDVVCALTSAGRVHCAGPGFPRTAPFDWDTPVVASEPLVSLDIAGYLTFCGRGVSGAVHCWGDNADGEAGTGARGNQPEPTPVAGEERFSSVSGDLFSTCATRQSDGRVVCWGEHPAGSPPVLISTDEPRAQPDDGWAAVFHDGFTRYMIGDDGALYVVGTRLLGLGEDAGPATEPTRVGAEVGWTALAIARQDHVCGIRAGELYCWGDGGAGATGQLGDPREVPSPARVGVDDDWTRVAVAQDATCAIRGSGELYCFGRDFADDGALARIDAPTPFAEVALADDRSACAVTTGGALRCFGDNRLGRRVPGGPDPLDAPTPVDDATDWARVAVGPFASCGIKTDGSLHCWGRDPAVEVDATASLMRGVTRVGDDTDWTHVFESRRHLCGLHADGRVECWGLCDNGAVGNGTCWIDEPTLVSRP